MNIFADNFLTNQTESDAIFLVKTSRCEEFYNIGIFLAEFMEKKFPNNPDIKDEHGIMLYYAGKHEDSYSIFSDLLYLRGLDEGKSQHAIFNQHFCIESIKDKYTTYNNLLVSKIPNNSNKSLPLITFTITSCKRYDLFCRTMNSFTNCCKDIHLIDEWFCIDDNSSEEDREKMQKEYPFFTFYFKTSEEKGHPQSMNIIRNHVSTPYIFHMEDDWQFFERRNYISECLEVLGQSSSIGQCLINKNYAEIASHHDIKGGIFKTTSSGLRYYIHEFCPTEELKKTFSEKYGNVKCCSYWPHFSFRPSLFRTRIFQELGEFNEKVSHFEMDYSSRYVNKGYTSAFLEGVYCIHIGRLTSERDSKEKLNAYDLNNEAQFSGKEELEIFSKIKTFVVNLDRRPDRWETFIKHDEPNFLKYERFSAIDGTRLKPTLQLRHIFEHNNHNMRKGIVGCAMSHLKLYIDLLKDKDTDIYCILEDDVEFVPEFEKKLKYCFHSLSETNWDLFYLGHHLWPQFIDNEVYSKELWPKIEQFNRSESLMCSMGGTIGYMITKKGVEKLLEYINLTGMTNGIDTVQQKSADILNVYYSYPHLIYSKCFLGDNKIDSDIQFNYESISINEELKEYIDICEVNSFSEADKLIESKDSFYFYSEDPKEISHLKEKCTCLNFTLSENILIVIAENDYDNSKHRFKRNGVWSINNALFYY
jgi:GR25 family glycosyltransferase involved in LPS biosynthesis